MDFRSTKMKERIRRGDPERQRHWEKVVRGWKASGQSVREYCRAQGLRESAFFFWRRRLELRNRASEGVGKQRPNVSPLAPAALSPKKQSTLRRGTPSFLPVRVVEDTEVEAAHSVEIVLAHGRTVRVGSGFDRQTLAAVLAVLESRPC
jgi:transposase-like protein